jgi:HSP20 family molecular chaperone IbpA
MSDSKRLSIFLFILGLFIGSLATLTWNYFRPFNTKYGNITEIQKPQKPRSLLDMLIGENPVSDLMENMQTHMEKDENGGFQFHFNMGGSQNLEPSEDDKFYYFTLNLNDLKAKTLNVNVENNQIIVQAQLESAESDENSSHSISQSFSKAFPAPPNCNLDKIEVENKDNKIIIKVPKTN